MEPHRTTSLAPLAGVSVLVLAVVMIAVSGTAPEPGDATAGQIAAFYAENEAALRIATLLAVAVGGLLVLFAAHLRRLAIGVVGDVLLVGAGIFATGLALDAGITGALAVNAGQVDDAALVSLSALWYSNFLYVVGGGLFLAGTGIAVLRQRLAPRPFGWIMVGLGVAAVTPAGGIAFFGTLLMPAVIGTALAVRARRGRVAPGDVAVAS